MSSHRSWEFSVRKNFKYLGLFIDNTHSWKKQIACVSQRVTNAMRCLYRLKTFLPPITKLTLVHSLFILVSGQIHLIYLSLWKYDHVFSYRSQLQLPIRQRSS